MKKENVEQENVKKVDVKKGNGKVVFADYGYEIIEVLEVDGKGETKCVGYRVFGPDSDSKIFSSLENAKKQVAYLMSLEPSPASKQPDDYDDPSDDYGSSY